MRARIEKYKKNYNAKDVGKAYDATKTQAVRKEKVATEKLVYIEEAIKRLANGQSTIHIPYYIIFGKELYSKTLKHKDQTLLEEVCILEKKWQTRGLDNDILENIKYLLIPNYVPCEPPHAPFPTDARVFWTDTEGSIPAGWTRDSNFDERFLQGFNVYGNLGGNLTHNHTPSADPHTHTGDPHDHPMPITTSATGLQIIVGGARTLPKDDHGHGAKQSNSKTITYANSNVTINQTAGQPPFMKSIIIKPDDIDQDIPDDGIGLYDDSSLPTNFEITDGTGGTPNMADRFILGADSLGGAGGGIGGSLTHPHTSPAHTHVVSHHHHNLSTFGNASPTILGGDSGFINNTYRISHHRANPTENKQIPISTDSITINAASSEPLYIEILALQNKTGAPETPSGIILPFVGAVIPAGWLLCDGTAGTLDLTSRQFRITTNPANIGFLGGNPANLHNHTIPAHLHTHQAHNHTFTVENYNQVKGSGIGFKAPELNHIHSWSSDVLINAIATMQTTALTSSNVDGRYNYITVRFIKKQ